MGIYYGYNIISHISRILLQQTKEQRRERRERASVAAKCSTGSWWMGRKSQLNFSIIRSWFGVKWGWQFKPCGSYFCVPVPSTICTFGGRFRQCSSPIPKLVCDLVLRILASVVLVVGANVYEKQHSLYICAGYHCGISVIF